MLQFDHTGFSVNGGSSNSQSTETHYDGIGHLVANTGGEHHRWVILEISSLVSGGPIERLRWKDGDGINWNKEGDAPDFSAFDYEMNSLNTGSIQNFEDILKNLDFPAPRLPT